MLNQKFIRTMVKPISSLLGWLGGGIAGITVILSSLGYLVVRSHHELLGIADIVPNPPESWTIEGARFVYNSLFLLVVKPLSNGWIVLLLLGSLFWLVMRLSQNWSQKIADWMPHPALKMILAALTVLALLSLMGTLLRHQLVSNLLVVHQLADNPLAQRSQQQGIEALRETYALLESLLLLLWVWLLSLPRILKTPAKEAAPDAETAHSAVPVRWPLWQVLLWGIFLIPLLLLPMNYGKLVKPNEFYKVRLFTELAFENSTGQARQPAEEGWLLYHDDKTLVLYRGRTASEPVQILERQHFARIHIVTLENIFTEWK